MRNSKRLENCRRLRCALACGKCARPYCTFCSPSGEGKGRGPGRRIPTRRLATGRSVAAAESNQTRSPTAMRPESGLANPATQSSRVVLPAPEGPKTIVNPGAAWNSTSRANSSPPEGIRLRRETCRRVPCDSSLRSAASEGRDEGVTMPTDSVVRGSFIAVHSRELRLDWQSRYKPLDSFRPLGLNRDPSTAWVLPFATQPLRSG